MLLPSLFSRNKSWIYYYLACIQASLWLCNFNSRRVMKIHSVLILNRVTYSRIIMKKPKSHWTITTSERGQEKCWQNFAKHDFLHPFSIFFFLFSLTHSTKTWRCQNLSQNLNFEMNFFPYKNHENFGTDQRHIIKKALWIIIASTIIFI